MSKRLYSIKSILRLFSVFMIITTILAVIFIVAIGNNKLREYVAVANKGVLRVISDEIDSTLAGVDSQFYTISTISIVENDSIEKGKLLSYLRNMYQLYPLVNGLWYYMPEREEFVVSVSGVFSMDESDVILKDYKSRITSYEEGQPIESSKWRLEKINGNYYLTRLLKTGGTYCGAWIRIDSLTKSFPTGENAFLVFSSAKHEEFSGEGTFHKFVPDNELVSSVIGFDGSRYIASSLKAQAGDYYISYIVEEHLELFSQIDSEIFTMVIVALTAVMLFFISVAVLRKLIYGPLVSLKGTMSEVRQGNLSPAIGSSHLLEFQQINQTFEYMLEEINTLKIDVYEQRLERQRIKQRFLQIQLKSHFYLNCLNIIHSLAQVKNYSLIQDLTRSLGAYFSYIADDYLELNTLSKELEHLRNYMHIQEIRFPNHLSYIEDVQPELFGWELPPLVLQTFVENSVEHAIDLDEDNYIKLTIMGAEEGGAQGIVIHIQDNGKGFSTEQLERFNSCDDDTLNRGEEIGIKNVVNRLELIYEGKADIKFSNSVEGGAAVRIWIPMLAKVVSKDV